MTELLPQLHSYFLFFMKMAQYKQCKSSGVTGNILEKIIFVVSLIYAVGRRWEQT